MEMLIRVELLHGMLPHYLQVPLLHELRRYTAQLVPLEIVIAVSLAHLQNPHSHHGIDFHQPSNPFISVANGVLLQIPGQRFVTLLQ